MQSFQNGFLLACAEIEEWLSEHVLRHVGDSFQA